MIPRSGESGFTLVEMLVALVVLGFVVAGLAQGLHFGMTAWSVQSRAIAQDSALDTTDRVLRTLLARMEPGDDPRQPAVRGTAHTLEFTAELPVNAPIGPTRLADITLAVEPGAGLVMRWVPALHAQWIVPPTPRVTALLTSVTAIGFAYYGAQGTAPPEWHDAWTGAVPPALIRLHLSLPAGRHWPDIIVAPVCLPDSG